MPKAASDATISQLVLQSSFIDFSEIGQTLFRPGDSAKGFYWLLSGEVKKDAQTPNQKILRAGDFVGFEEFRSKTSHISNYTNTKPTQTLFINGKSFSLLQQLLGNAASTYHLSH